MSTANSSRLWVGGGTRRRLDSDALAAGDDRFRMRGRDVRDHALHTLPGLVHGVLDETGLDLDDINRFVFHQTNPKLLPDLTTALSIDPGRIPLTGPATATPAARPSRSPCATATSNSRSGASIGCCSPRSAAA